jgi:mRNA-degrading endonuclease RelE of RelBE toxin-antitoxin system
MQWTIEFTRQAAKQAEKLPQGVRAALARLALDMREKGPIRGDWPNYSKLTAERHYCHLKKGKPCYVAVWQVADKHIKLIEVIYAGTHEKAPY